jgi:predicted RND superfamily exporter protein
VRESALLFTSLALGVGFGVLTFAYMENSKEFGFLALFAIATAFLADVILGPALVTLVTRRRRGWTPALGTTFSRRGSAKRERAA